jgi:hypothetical protein
MDRTDSVATLELEDAEFWNLTAQTLQWLSASSQSSTQASIGDSDAGTISSLVYGPI